MKPKYPTKICPWCGKEHNWYGQSCSLSCRNLFRWHKCTKEDHDKKPKPTCARCGKVLIKQQKVFCSTKCANTKPRTQHEPRKCLWCGDTMYPPKDANRVTQWVRVVKCCSLSHGLLYRWHKCTKEEHEAKVAEKKYCLWCNKELVRHENEPNYNWYSRKFCGKKCASHNKKGLPQRKKQFKKTLEQAAGCVTYRPGDSRFEELRRMYEGRASVQARGCRV